MLAKERNWREYDWLCASVVEVAIRNSRANVNSSEGS